MENRKEPPFSLGPALWQAHQPPSFPLSPWAGWLGGPAAPSPVRPSRRPSSPLPRTAHLAHPARSRPPFLSFPPWAGLAAAQLPPRFGPVAAQPPQPARPLPRLESRSRLWVGPTRQPRPPKTASPFSLSSPARPRSSALARRRSPCPPPPRSPRASRPPVVSPGPLLPLLSPPSLSPVRSRPRLAGAARSRPWRPRPWRGVLVPPRPVRRTPPSPPPGGARPGRGSIPARPGLAPAWRAPLPALGPGEARPRPPVKRPQSSGTQM
jgi:hypothetical protein